MKDFKKYFEINEEPDVIYAALTNPTTIKVWSGGEAVLSTEPGSEFSLFDDSIAGKNLEFIEGKLIRQEWYFGDQEEPSIVTIKLHPKGSNGTSIELRHTNIPDEVYDEMTEGWIHEYFGALQAFYM
jgi:activator of HSP90 ATPase